MLFPYRYYSVLVFYQQIYSRILISWASWLHNLHQKWFPVVPRFLCQPFQILKPIFFSFGGSRSNDCTLCHVLFVLTERPLFLQSGEKPIIYSFTPKGPSDGLLHRGAYGLYCVGIFISFYGVYLMMNCKTKKPSQWLLMQIILNVW